MPTRKIKTSELRQGMYVEALDRPWLETGFLYQGVPVRCQDDIDALARNARYVYVTDRTDERAPDIQPAATTGKAARPSAGELARDRSPRKFFRELSAARQVRASTRELISNVHRDIRAGRGVNVEMAQRVVEQMTDSVARHAEALVWFTTLKNRDDYTAEHSMNVCMFAVTFGSYLGLDDERLITLGMGALLHDIGKIRVPLAILNKPGRLTAEELVEVRKHPQYGVDILKDESVLSPESLDMVLSHHERLDGSGYPRRLVDDQISYFSQLLAIVDVYDAMTSHRVYHRGRSPAEVLALMSEETDIYNDALLEQFRDCIGDYPVGNLVELNTGEVGFVVPRIEPGDRDLPLLLMVLDHNKRRYYPQRIQDLARFERFEIARSLPCGSYNVDVEELACHLDASHGLRVG